MEFVVEEELVGQERVDVYLVNRSKERSRSFIQKIISEGCVTVNGKVVKANAKVKSGDSVVVQLPVAQPTPDILPEDIPLAILYEDADMIVINKARGMVVHPAAGNYQGTLVNALLKHCTDLSGINGEIRPGIVHRLDKDTSGAMVAAKHDQAHINLAEQIKSRTAGRLYWAIVHGNIKEEKGVINAPIGRHATDRKKMAVTFTNSKEAITHFTVVERYSDYTLVACKLLTGRTHQIRVHMAYIGHPVANDPKYGPKTQPFAIDGQALHAKELHLKHPITGEEMTFTAPLPADMENILRILKNKKR